jgi:hypothetical protein
MQVECADGVLLAEIALWMPDELPVSRVSWITHPILDGACPIAGIGWDVERSIYVVMLGAGGQARTYNKVEWLAAHPQWAKVKDIE